MVIPENKNREYVSVTDAGRGVSFNYGDKEKHPVYIKNMYRNYGVGSDGGLESVPGYRRLIKWNGNIHGIWSFILNGEEKIAVHEGTRLHIFNHSERDYIASGDDKTTHNLLITADIDGLCDADSFAFFASGSFFINDGNGFYRLDGNGGEYSLTDITDCAYFPVTYIDGERYEQRNLLCNRTKNRFSSLAEMSSDRLYHYSDTNTIDGFAPEINMSLAAIPSSYELANRVFNADNRLKSVIYLGSGVHDYAFYNCVNLENVYTNTIGKGFCYGCRGLKKVYFGGESFGTYSSYNNCTSVNEIHTSGALPLKNTNQAVFSGITEKSFSFYTTSSGVDSASCTNLAAAYKVGHIKISGGSEYTYPVTGYHTVNGDGNILGYVIKKGQRVGVSEGYMSYDGETLPVKFYGSIIKLTSSTLKGPFDIYEDENLYTRLTDIDGNNLSLSCYIKNGYAYPGEYGQYAPDTVLTVYPDSPMPEYTGDSLYFAQTMDCAEGIVDVFQSGKSADAAARGEIFDGNGYLSGAVFAYDLSENGYFDVVLKCADARVRPASSEVREDYPDLYSANPYYTGNAADAIIGCTKEIEYDGRIFLTGNPDLPNTVFYSGVGIDGAPAPTYFGVCNFFNDGNGTDLNIGFMKTGGMLCVVKGGLGDEKTICFHQPDSTGKIFVSKVYPMTDSIGGMSGIGKHISVGGDCLFLSDGGLEGIRRSGGNMTTFHASGRVDRELTYGDLSKACICVWRGYIVIFCEGGRVYLADTRQKDSYDGRREYEWYTLEGIGEYVGRKRDAMLETGDFGIEVSEGFDKTTLWLDRTQTYVDALIDGEIRRYPLMIAKTGWYSGDSDFYSSNLYKNESGLERYTYYESGANVSVRFIIDGDKAYLRDANGEVRYSGGILSSATKAACIGDVLYFGCASGALMCVNNDMEGKPYYTADPGVGKLHRHWYTFDGSIEESSVTFAEDDCGYPDIAKNTVQDSFVLNACAMNGSVFDVKVMTDTEPVWKTVSTECTSMPDFSQADFEAFSFSCGETVTKAVCEDMKQWTRKQIHITTNGRFMSPLGLYGFSYRYNLKGNIKA